MSAARRSPSQTYSEVANTMHEGDIWLRGRCPYGGGTGPLPDQTSPLPEPQPNVDCEESNPWDEWLKLILTNVQPDGSLGPDNSDHRTYRSPPIWVPSIATATDEEKRLEACIETLHRSTTRYCVITRKVYETLLDNLQATREYIRTWNGTIDTRYQHCENQQDQPPQPPPMDGKVHQVVTLGDDSHSVWGIDSMVAEQGTDWSRARCITQGAAEEAMIMTASWASKTLIKLLEDPEVGRTEYVWPLTLMQACRLDLNGKGMRAAGMVKLLNQMICTTNASIYCLIYDVAPDKTTTDDSNADTTTPMQMNLPYHSHPGPKKMKPDGRSPTSRKTVVHVRPLTDFRTIPDAFMTARTLSDRSWGWDPTDTLCGAHIMCKGCGTHVGLAGTIHCGGGNINADACECGKRHTQGELTNHNSWYPTKVKGMTCSNIYQLVCTTCQMCRECCEHVCVTCSKTAKQGWPWCMVHLQVCCEAHCHSRPALHSQHQSVGNAKKAIKIRMEHQLHTDRSSSPWMPRSEQNHNTTMAEAEVTYNHRHWNDYTVSEAREKQKSNGAVIAMLPVKVTATALTDSDDEVTIKPKETVIDLDQHGLHSPSPDVKQDTQKVKLQQEQHISTITYVAANPKASHKQHLYSDCMYIPKRVMAVPIQDESVRQVCTACSNRRDGIKKRHNNHSNADEITDAMRNISLDGPILMSVNVTSNDDAVRIAKAFAKTKCKISITGSAGEQHKCVIAPAVLGAPSEVNTKRAKNVTEPVCEAVSENLDGKFQELLGFVAFIPPANGSVGMSNTYIENAQPVIVVPDTAAEVSVIDMKLVNKLWTSPTQTEVEIAGALDFGDKQLQGERRVPTQLRWGSEMIHLDLRPSSNVLKELRGADILMGVPALKSLGAIIDCAQHRLFIANMKQWIFLEPVTRLVERRSSKPMNVISLCGGVEIVYSVIRDLGFNVNDWEAHEIESNARTLARRIVPCIRHPSPQDILKLSPTYIADQRPHLVLLSSPCQPFSQAQTSFTPHGLTDPRAEPLIFGSQLIAHAMTVNKELMFLSEQVVVHRALKDTPAKQDELIGANKHGHGYVGHNAKDAGSPSSRPRRLAQNITSCALNDTPKLRPIDPNSIVDDGCRIKTDVIPCIVASRETHNVPKCTDPAIGERQLNRNEKERAMGYPTNILRLDKTITGVKVEAILGMCLNYWQMAAIFSRLDPNRLNTAKKAIISAAPLMLGATGDSLEQSFLKLTPDETLEWMKQRMKDINFEVPKLRLKLRDPHMLPYKSKTKNTVQAGLAASVSKWTKMAEKRGWIRKVPYSHELWISSTFYKSKNRLDEDGLTEVRPLVDQRIVSSALMHPLYWLESMTTQNTMRNSVSAKSKFFADIDLKSGYNMLYVHEDSLYLQGVWIAGELYQYLVTIQGQSTAACWFNFVLELCLDALLGCKHYDYYCRFVDDFCITGETRQQAQNRKKIVSAALTAIGFEISDKNDGDIKDHGNCAGVKFTAKGISLNDDGINAIKLAIAKSPQRAADCKTLIGSILYAHTAFELNIEDITWFATMLQPMHQACTSILDTKGKRLNFKWTEQCEANRIELGSKILNIPRMFTHPNELVTDETCLYILSDACDTGGGCTLHYCRVPDARDVVPEVHLRDPTMSRLLDCKYRCFSPKKQELPTFELELGMAHTAVIEWGNLITILTYPYPPGDDKPCKIGIGTDSSTTESKLTRLTKSLIYDIPPEPIPYISARAKRMLDMADSIAYSRNWPMICRHTAGRSNSLCDLISRIAFQLKAVAEEHKRDKAVVYPLRIHTYHKEPDNNMTVEATYKGLQLNAEQTNEMVRAYETDPTQYKKVKMCAVYRALETGGASLEESPQAESERISAWIGKRFFLKDRLMWTQASFVQLRDSQYIQGTEAEDGIETDQTRTLVLVIPDLAKITISDPAPTADSDSHDEIKDQMHLRQNLMWVAHEASMHAGASEMARSIRLIAWWSTLLADCKRHTQTCSVCIQRQHPALGIGMSTGANRRMSTIQFDHCVSDPVIAEHTQIWGVLTIVDVATGCICLAPAKTKLARETAYLLFVYWIRTYGIPMVIRL